MTEISSHPYSPQNLCKFKCKAPGCCPVIRIQRFLFPLPHVKEEFMTIGQKNKIINLRLDGCSYSTISQLLEIPVPTIKAFCQRHREEIQQRRCRTCGTPLKQPKGKRKKYFCSDRCRTTWWNTHPEAINRKAWYHLQCQICGKEFDSYGNRNRKFCSRECYYTSRRHPRTLLPSGATDTLPSQPVTDRRSAA